MATTSFLSSCLGFRMYKDQAKWPRAKFLDLLMTRPLARRLWVAYSARQVRLGG